MLHYQSDVMMNGAILIALGLAWYGWHRADALFALGIGIYILYSALRMGYEAVQSLLDRAFPMQNVMKFFYRDLLAWRQRCARSSYAAVRADPLYSDSY
jgi:ferrous-iron efflux pump FieF